MAYQEPIAQYFTETTGVEHIEIDDAAIERCLVHRHEILRSRFDPISLLLTDRAAEGVDEIGVHFDVSFWKLNKRQRVLHPYEAKYTLGKTALYWLRDFRKFPEFPYDRYIRKGLILLDHDNKRLDVIKSNSFYKFNRWAFSWVYQQALARKRV